jgi:hypothetical protein
MVCLLINIINFSIENGFRINSSIINFVYGGDNGDEHKDDDKLIDNNVNSKSSVSKQVIIHTLTLEFISLVLVKIAGVNA